MLKNNLAIWSHWTHPSVAFKIEPRDESECKDIQNASQSWLWKVNGDWQAIDKLTDDIEILNCYAANPYTSMTRCTFDEYFGARQLVQEDKGSEW